MRLSPVVAPLAVASSAVASLALLTACQGPAASVAAPSVAGAPGAAAAAPGVQHLDPASFASAALANGTSRSDVVVLDVRTPPEVAMARLPGASVITWGDPRFDTRAALIARDKPLYVYCASGVRSANAAERLVELGFTRVSNLRGGILGWRAAGQPIERGSAAAESSADTLEPAAFDAKVRAAPTILVEYETPWCTPCQRLAPRVQAATAARKLALLKVNIDASEALAARERVVGVPVLALFRDGREVARHAGELDDAALGRWLDTTGAATAAQ